MGHAFQRAESLVEIASGRASFPESSCPRPRGVRDSRRLCPGDRLSTVVVTCVGKSVGVTISPTIGSGLKAEPLGSKVGVSVGDGRGVDVALGVGVTVSVSVGVLLGITVGVLLGITVGVLLGITVGVLLGITVLVGNGVSVGGRALGVNVGMGVGVSVLVGEGVAVGMRVGVNVGKLRSNSCTGRFSTDC